MNAGNPRILAVASGGGHWVQLLRLRPAFEGVKVSFLTTDGACARDLSGARLFVVRDASRWSKFGLLIQALQVLWILVRVRPHIVITTGAAPGFFAIMFGRLLGRRTIWIDSIANAEKLSLSGSKAGKWANLWLTQWSHLASESGPLYRGSVL